MLFLPIPSIRIRQPLFWSFTFVHLKSLQYKFLDIIFVTKGRIEEGGRGDEEEGEERHTQRQFSLLQQDYLYWASLFALLADGISPSFLLAHKHVSRFTPSKHLGSLSSSYPYKINTYIKIVYN
jgi:hypothetical protein